ncbi:hypothetical protein CFP56_027339 [Quercus suber]|uniref:Uncharacterized protein n=1 Tax=Quercus suber TaxID=58331 RepID=A0AAW0LY94_QUESU
MSFKLKDMPRRKSYPILIRHRTITERVRVGGSLRFNSVRSHSTEIEKSVAFDRNGLEPVKQSLYTPVKLS